ncbi:phosphopantetheine-binding protein, partial [Chromobacterium piscinae]
GLSAALLAQVAETLPDYMVPSALAVLPEWPVNINGKIDRKALPAIRPQNAAAGREPANDAERLLCAAVARVLNLEQTSPDDDFFLLGGDSISAMSLGTELRRAGFLLRPRDVFAKRTPAGIRRTMRHGQPFRPGRVAEGAGGAERRTPGRRPAGVATSPPGVAQPRHRWPTAYRCRAGRAGRAHLD